MEKHVINTRFVGTADLESPEHGVVLLHASVAFDPLALEFTLYIPAGHPMVDCLADESRSVPLLLRSVCVSSEEVQVDMRADLLELYRQNSLHEWPECMGGIFCKEEEQDEGMRRLLLGPSDQKVEFCSELPISECHPYQFYYSDACSTAMQGQIGHYAGNHAQVDFCQDFPRKGIVCVFGGAELADIEDRLHAALMLCHGRSLPPVLLVQEQRLTFFRYRSSLGLSTLPLLARGSGELMEKVLSGFLAMTEKDFRLALRALKLFVAGKQSAVAVEVQYILLMMCVETMDGEQTRTLTESTTAALLGVSNGAALLFNGMRHKLVHGRGDCQQAFAEFMQEKVKGRMLDLEPEIQLCLPEDGSFDFSRLGLRLCERLDAFWCAYLQVPPQLTLKRAFLSWIPLMPPVDLNALHCAISIMENKKQKRNELVPGVKLHDPEKIKGNLDKQRVQVINQGKLIGELKSKIRAQHAELEALRAQLVA